MAGRKLKELSTQELSEMAEGGLDAFAAAMEELAHRKKGPGKRLFEELMVRLPEPGSLDHPEAKRTSHVCVIDLDPKVLESAKFRRRNPRYQADMLCVYVGMTGKSPEARFEQHKANDGAGKYVSEFGRKLLPKLYADRNPLTRREALIYERALAFELREKGYGVWQG